MTTDGGFRGHASRLAVTPVACASAREFLPARFVMVQTERRAYRRATKTYSRLSSSSGPLIESAVESFQPQARDVEQPQPFILGRPPEGTSSTIVQGDVDSVIADAVVVCVRHRKTRRRVGMLSPIVDAM